MKIKNFACQIGPAAAGSVGPVPTALCSMALSSMLWPPMALAITRVGTAYCVVVARSTRAMEVQSSQNPRHVRPYNIQF